MKRVDGGAMLKIEPVSLFSRSCQALPCDGRAAVSVSAVVR